MSENKDMLPMSGELVETDGVYRNERGREMELQRGDVFPADPQLGSTEWELVELRFANHHEGRTDPRLYPKENDIDKQRKQLHPRQHLDSGDK